SKQFFVQVAFEDSVAEHEVTTNLLIAQELRVELGDKGRRTLHLKLDGNPSEVRWQISSQALPQAKAMTGSGSDCILIFPGRYNLFVQAGDDVAMQQITVAQDQAETFVEVKLERGQLITPTLGGALTNVTMILLDANRRPLGMPPIAILEGREDSADLIKAWRVPNGRYVIRGSMLGRNIERRVEVEGSDVTVVLE
ncbi:MAG: hypothetical protein KDB07_11660, partial [Planctomycetes bacterium]|nr:hypothetical protein [Planctomycetota bacterium]